MVHQSLDDEGTQDHRDPRSPSGELSDDLLNAALLFLDDAYEDTDSDSINSTHSTHSADPDHEQERPQRSEPQVQTANTEAAGPPVDGEERRSEKRGKGRPGPLKLAPATTVLDASGNPVRISTEGQAFRPVRRHRVNKHKIEIDILRLEVDALQARIQELQSQPSTTQQELALRLNAALGSTWEKVAAQQLERLERSETENQRLKELIAEHRRVAKSIRRIAVRHINSKSWIPIRPPPIRSVSSHCVSELEDPAMFQMLLMSLGQMFAQTESAVAFNPGRILNKERHGDSHLTIKLQNSRCVPFGLAKTADAMWNYTLLEEDIQNLQYTTVSEGTVQSKFISYVDLSDFHGQAEGKLVVSRINQPDRTVIVRHSLFHCLAGAHKNRFLALPVHHFLWVVVDRPPQFANGPAQDMMSRIRTCAVTLPRLDTGDDCDPKRDAEIDELLRMNLQIATQLCDQAYDTVDNLLMGTGPPLGSKMVPWHAVVPLEGSATEGIA